MPELVEQMYCSQQIVIPPKFPYILKRFCKAAIKTQPYDLLRWSYEYFTALAEKRSPPVKLRLEYPVYSTEGGLTRGCLKVIAHQLQTMQTVPLFIIRKAWQGFCLDPNELRRIFCLCEVYKRRDHVPFLHFIALAGGLLTKNLTYTMILLCEALTKEPDGGSASIPADDFLTMYRFLARMDASSDVKYIDGYREGEGPPPEEEELEEEQTVSESFVDPSIDDFWQGAGYLHRVSLVDDAVTMNPRISTRSKLPAILHIPRSLSAERAAEIDRDNYMRQRKDRALLDDKSQSKLKQMSSNLRTKADDGEPDVEEEAAEHTEEEYQLEEEAVKEEAVKEEGKINVEELITELLQARERRRNDLQKTFDALAIIVDKFNTANYDLGMVAGRQMSITSGEFIVHHIEKDIMDYINAQIAILPDPDLKKRKAKPEEVIMVKELLYKFLDDSMEIIIPELEEAEEEELPIPEIVVAYAVPGIGPHVPEEIIDDIEEYVEEVRKIQADMFMPRNIRHFLCPPLEKYEECTLDEPRKEELACSGVLTD